MGTAWCDMDKVDSYKVGVAVNAAGNVFAVVTLYAGGRGRRFVIETSYLQSLWETVDKLGKRPPVVVPHTSLEVRNVLQEAILLYEGAGKKVIKRVDSDDVHHHGTYIDPPPMVMVCERCGGQTDCDTDVDVNEAGYRLVDDGPVCGDCIQKMGLSCD